jgi:hypothetical protein
MDSLLFGILKKDNKLTRRQLGAVWVLETCIGWIIPNLLDQKLKEIFLVEVCKTLGVK